MEFAMKYLGILRRTGQRLGPYLIVELLLPGGTMLALLLFAWRRRGRGRAEVAARGIALGARTALQQGVSLLRAFEVWPVHGYHPAGREACATAVVDPC